MAECAAGVLILAAISTFSAHWANFHVGSNTEFMSHRNDRDRHVPRWVPYFNAVAKPLLALGVPIGPDVLITVRGRKTGLPRTTPVTLGEYAGRRGVIGAFGESDWARNLRAAGTATIRFGRRREEIRAVELKDDQAVAFMTDVVAPIARRSRLGNWFVRNIDKIDIDHPRAAVRGRPVFEIFPLHAEPQN